MLSLFASFAMGALQPSQSAPPKVQSAGTVGIGPRLADVRRFAAAEGDRLWPGYGGAPFEFLLVEAKEESLLCRASVPAGFTAAGRDSATGCDRFVRPRGGLPNTLLAAMPLFGPPPTIVMGTPETTGRSPASWLRTILHEHFHQWQFSLPDYFARIDALDLKGDDGTGMWALNFAFPYDRADVVAAQTAASVALADAVAARGTRDFYTRFDAYCAARQALARAAGERNWRYAEFQLWQEGVARWTEIALGKAYPDAAVAKSAVALEEHTLAELRKPAIADQKREFVYAYGAAEAMLLDACGPGWRKRYPAVLALGPLLAEARATCGKAD